MDFGLVLSIEWLFDDFGWMSDDFEWIWMDLGCVFTILDGF